VSELMTSVVLTPYTPTSGFEVPQESGDVLPTKLDPTSIVSFVADISVWQRTTPLLLPLQATGSRIQIRPLRDPSVAGYSSFNTDSSVVALPSNTKAIQLTRCPASCKHCSVRILRDGPTGHVCTLQSAHGLHSL
jgi:hypothetical protein